MRFVAVLLPVVAAVVSRAAAAEPPPTKPVAAKAEVVFDDRVALAPDEACTTDCGKRCNAGQASACLVAAQHTQSPPAWCKAGDLATCRALAGKATGEDATKLNDQAKVWEAKWAAACGPADPWACRYAASAKSIDDATSLRFATTGCKLGIWRLCRGAFMRTADVGTQHLVQLANIAARACRDRGDVSICADAAAILESRDGARAAALRARGLAIATAGCKRGGVDAIEPCEWVAAVTADAAERDRFLQVAVAAADAGCKARSVKACMLGAGLWRDLLELASGWTGTDGHLVSPRFISIPKHVGDSAKARALLTEACRLANPTSEVNFECDAARDAGIDVTTLAPPPPSTPKHYDVTIKPKASGKGGGHPVGR